MNAQDVVRQLRKDAKESAAKIYRRHGVKDEVLGVRYAAMGKLVKSLPTDHDLACELWATGIHEARVVATKIADPARLTRAEADRWLADAQDYVLVDAVSALAARASDAGAWAERWMLSPREWTSAAGWNVVSLLAMNGALDPKAGEKLLGIIRKRIHDAPNRTRYAMNGALISIGGSMPGLTDVAIEAAEAIGTVDVDHGQTGCKTPVAADYIRKMAARALARTRVTGARMKPASAKRRKSPQPRG